MPKNCTECEYTKTCKSHFGGLGCKHKEEIVAEGRKAVMVHETFDKESSED